jgi:hypothetical protein
MIFILPLVQTYQSCARDDRSSLLLRVKPIIVALNVVITLKNDVTLIIYLCSTTRILKAKQHPWHLNIS